MSAAPKFENIDKHEQIEDEPVMFYAHKKKHDDSEGIWLMSYADLMTLLMGFFALMLSLSKFDEQKIDQVRAEATKAFGGKYQTHYDDLEQEFKEVISQENLNGKIDVKKDASGLSLIFTGNMLFDSGSITLRTDAEPVISKIAELVSNKANQFYLLIEGHTDDAPISEGVVASNWELSGLRASAVARILEAKGFVKNRLTIIGWGEQRPVKPNLDKQGNPILENRAANRRVVLKVMKQQIL